MHAENKLPKSERRRQRAGNLLLAAGLGIFALAAITSGWWEPAEHNGQAAASVRDLVMRSAYATAIVLVICSALERVQRPTRAMLHQIVQRMDAQDVRADLIEETFADLAAVMPKEHAKQWWRGAAEVGGSDLAATGTDSNTSGDVLRLVRDRSRN